MIRTIISSIIISAGLFFMMFGIIGVYRFSNFYARILITAKVETVGFLAVMIGILVQSGFSYFSLKIVLIALFFMLTNPLSTHAIGRSAFYSNLSEKEMDND